MQTAFSITDANFFASSDTPGTVTLTVDFDVHRSGPAHVAGLIVTTDYWATTAMVPAVFQAHGEGFEYWRAKYSVSTSPPVAFEFVIYCDDFGAKDGVVRIWNTNGVGVPGARLGHWSMHIAQFARRTSFASRLSVPAVAARRVSALRRVPRTLHR